VRKRERERERERALETEREGGREGVLPAERCFQPKTPLLPDMGKHVFLNLFLIYT
jgi:hypothetical protein